MLNNNNTAKTENEKYRTLRELAVADQKAVAELEVAITGRAAELAAKYPVKVVGLYRDPFAPRS
jgi:hypothetical protein